LVDGVAMVSKAVASRSVLPILSHILLEQDAVTGRLVLTATDLELWVRHALPIPQQALAEMTGGAATVPAKNFAELLAAMPDAPVELSGESGDNQGYALHMRGNRANYKLLGLAPDEFPLLPEVAEDVTFTISRTDAKNAIRQTIFAVSTDDSRPVLTGILLDVKLTGLKFVATDTHRLAVREVPLSDFTGKETRAVVPARAMQEVLRIVSAAEDGVINVTLTENQVKFVVEDNKSGTHTTVISRLIEGQFPSYERVIPQSFERRLTIEREAMLASLRRAAIVAREGSAHRIVVRTNENYADGERLTITAESGNLGNAFEEVDFVREGNTAPIEIAFNAKYMLDVLGAFDDQGFYLDLTEPLRPGVVRPTESTSYFCVLMPMQVV
jgi:DNA polymerase-3 subunit beta